ncbi:MULTISPECIES: hypothetical protein [Acinetobacter]|uniref:hypothetical protein n=1 Tax=Acinetobacter TaxID=469 RepID=UPI000EA3F740|nr:MULTISPECIES: hypothetical protein [Acinetobacter]RKG43828.1 hypothetical protein D7V51_09190 [Acinetobacter cumulans]RZG59543.1 hypothetical protein EXE29_08010 [Acinetobacter sp. WCHAc060006]
MHSAKPYGLSVEGGLLSERDSAFIDVSVRRFSDFKQAGNVESLRRTAYLPDGGYFVISDMAGILKVLAYKRSDERFSYTGFAKSYVPMLYSGCITDAKPQADQGTGLMLSEQTRARLSGYGKREKPAKKLKLHRFNVSVNESIVNEFAPKNMNAVYMTTQYVQQRPTWYSGAMAEVMQIVGGYGIQDFESLPNNEFERAELALPEDLREAIEESIKNNLLPAYSGIPPVSGQFQYDYKFSNTDAVSFDSGGAPWLLKVNASGVWAMPMPCIPATATPEFYEWISEQGDSEILAILDRFGAMPSGEGFPENHNDFFAWHRAGAIIKVCDTADFYSFNAYTEVCGWSFNLNGTEGINTCWGVNPDTGISIGYTYLLNASFMPAENRGMLGKVTMSQQDAQSAGPYLSALIPLLPAGTVKAASILYKLRRADSSMILSRLGQTVNEDEVNYWYNLTMEPIAKHSGNIRRYAEGYLYHNAAPKNQPQIKFPDTWFGACISFDFGAYQPVPASQRPNCDTIMYGYYIGDSIKTISYFVDWRSYQKEVVNNFEPVMTVGSWEQTEISGQSSPHGHFYISDLDLREIYDPVTITTKITGRDKGFDSQPFFAFDHFFSMSGSVWRNRYYTHETIVTRSNDQSLGVAVCIPYFMRNAALTASQKLQTSQSVSESLALHSITDPTSYRMWTYDFIFAWNNPLEKMTGVPYPKDGNPVWVEILKYAPSDANAFADQGPWLPNLPYDIRWLVHPSVHEWKQSGGGGPPKVHTYSKSSSPPAKSSNAIYASIQDEPLLAAKDTRVTEYFLPSPDETGNYVVKDGCKAVFGSCEYANISESNERMRRIYWGYTSLADHSGAHHFIGVINE